MKGNSDVDTDDDVSKEGASTASHSKNKHRCDTVIIVHKAGVVVAGRDNIIRGIIAAQVNGCSLHINIDESLACVMKPNPKMFPNALTRTGPCAGRAYALIVNRSRKLTDAGLTQEFIQFTDRLAVQTKEKTHKDLYVLVLLQKAMFNIYAKNNEAALEELKAAEQLSEHCLNRNLLLGKCYTYEAYIRLYQEKYEEALMYIENAKYLLVNVVSGEEKAMICYLTGYVYMKIAGKKEEPCQELEDKAIEYFQLHDRHVKEDSESEVAIKEMQYGIIKQATVYLRTYTFTSFQFGTNDESIEKAKELLDFFELHLWKDATPASKIHFTALKADYLYRRKCFERSLHILTTNGLTLAKDVGHKPMIDMVDERIRIIETSMGIKNERYGQ